MKYEYLYICDGNVADCEKTHCAWNGTGDCRHTTNVKHARYPEPHEWAWEAKEAKRHVFCEQLREEA